MGNLLALRPPAAVESTAMDPALVAAIKDAVREAVTAALKDSEPKSRRTRRVVAPAIKPSERAQSQAIARFGLCDTRKR